MLCSPKTSYSLKDGRQRRNKLERVYTFSVIGTPIAAPAGETCLKLAAAGKPKAIFNSFTNGQALSESRYRPWVSIACLRGGLECQDKPQENMLLRHVEKLNIT